ncbi:Retrovirus-related Pol polyprotein from transposon RE2, partial [Bienertia sinuspersici]
AGANSAKPDTTPSDATVFDSSAFLAGNYCLLSLFSNAWIIDSGATDHMCCSLHHFSTYDSISNENHTITIPDGTKVKVTHKGTVQLANGILLQNVLLVPGFRFNLISVTRLSQVLSCEIIFTKSNCLIQGHSKGMPIALGKLQSGLYCTEATGSNTSIANAVTKGLSTTTLEEVKLMHLRLGHLPIMKLKYLLPHLDIPSTIDFFCQICPLAKQHRLSFSHSSIKTCKPFQLLHVDVWGPYRIPTYDNCTYFLTIVDDYTRYTWVHL